MNKELSENESIIEGHWITKDGDVIGDENCQRIKFLIENALEFVTQDESGWQKLYIDRAFNNYWELTHPQSEMHGGGPPTLKRIDDKIELRKTYKVI